eukprot:scaffold363_cov216-Skeletonema_marinoi.AAC.15
MNLLIVIGMFFDGDEGAFVESEERGLDGMGAEPALKMNKVSGHSSPYLDNRDAVRVGMERVA